LVVGVAAFGIGMLVRKGETNWLSIPMLSVGLFLESAIAFGPLRAAGRCTALPLP
jgi:hypothetical protein